MEIEKIAWDWVREETGTMKVLDEQYYCPTRDIMQARMDKMTGLMIKDEHIGEEHAYVISAIAGEIGNNSFDHNIGNWPDVAGVFFAYNLEGNKKQIILADRGVGVFATLKKVKPELDDDARALETVFKERLSGRLPERRGNGLKFVRESIAKQHFHLSFYSGNALAELNDKISIGQSGTRIQGCFANLTLSIIPDIVNK